MHNKIKLVCSKCGNKDECVNICPFTGFQYSEGWHLVCTNCGANMVEKSKKKKPANVLNELDQKLDSIKSFLEEPSKSCDFCGKSSYVLYGHTVKRGVLREVIIFICDECEDHLRRQNATIHSS
jgi:hypothetical protein